MSSKKKLAVANVSLPKGGKTQFEEVWEFDEEVQYIGMTPATLLNQMGNLRLGGSPK